MALVWIILSVFLVSLLSFVGVLTLAVKKEKLNKLLIHSVAFASGSLLAAAFLHMLPEATEGVGSTSFSLVLAGILLFFVVEKFIHWHHCGKGECSIHPVAYLNVLGDGVHNFIDGVIIAAAYLTSFEVGVVATVAIALHEIPQEFGDFAVLLHSGLTTRKALAYNFLSATTAILGGLLGFVFLSGVEHLVPYAVALAAGGFIYIATADLIPELHKEKEFNKMLSQTVALLLGVVLIYAAISVMPHEHSHSDGLHEHNPVLGGHVENKPNAGLKGISWRPTLESNLLESGTLYALAS